MTADANMSSKSQGNRPDLLTKYLLVQMSLRDTGLGRSRVPTAVLQCLIEHDGPNGVFVGRARLANLCCVDRSRITNALNVLKDQGYINWKQRWNEKAGEWHSNIYTINYDKVPDAKTPGPLPECQETSAVDELIEHIGENYFLGTNDPRNIAESICEAIREQSPSEFVGRRLFSLLREAEKQSGLSSELNSMILDRLEDINQN